jgi:hypothetical protein
MKREELKIKNSGTKEYPYYLVMIGNVEFCATNSEDNAKRIVEALSLPPAEGAKTQCPSICPRTAEGTGEIGVYDIANKWAVLAKGNEVATRDAMLIDFYGLLNANAQKIADKMYADTEADGYVFCGKCGKMKEI